MKFQKLSIHNTVEPRFSATFKNSPKKLKKIRQKIEVKSNFLERPHFG
jgi:hypothetical protein